MARTTLFKKCLGFTDAKSFGSQVMKTNMRDPEVGSTEVIACRNMTITKDGCLQKLNSFNTNVVTVRDIEQISAGKRFFVDDGIDTKEWNGLGLNNLFPIISGNISHTNIDVRVCVGNNIYKSLNSSPLSMEFANLGSLSHVPTTSKPYYKMPTYEHAFIYNSKLYAVSGKFLQYSEDYAYDLWCLGDSFISSKSNILEAGAIPNCLVTTHANGISVYVGSNPDNFAYKFYDCLPIDKTLFSGKVSDGFAHILLCDDGIYAVSQDGVVSNLTSKQISDISSINAYYNTATLYSDKYLAFGNNTCIEYDTGLKTVLLHDTFGITGSAIWNNKTYFASGKSVITYGDNIDVSSDFVSSVTLPFSDWSMTGTKSIEAIYFTGTLNGEVTFTVTDNFGKYFDVSVDEALNYASRFRIKTPRGMMGNHLSLKINCISGAFRIEEIEVEVASSNRTR